MNQLTGIGELKGHGILSLELSSNLSFLRMLRRPAAAQLATNIKEEGLEGLHANEFPEEALVAD